MVAPEDEQSPPQQAKDPASETNNVDSHNSAASDEGSPEDYIERSDATLANSESGEQRIRREQEASPQEPEDSHPTASVQVETTSANDSASLSEEELTKRAKEASLRELEAVRLRKQSEYKRSLG